MAHVRRKFMDIVKITKKPGIASKIIDIISKLYDIERMAKELPYEQIYQIRQERSLPIIEQLHQTLLYYQDQAPPTSILGKAINYPLKQWPKLVVYLENGQIRIDNNDCERAIKPFVIGRLCCASHNLPYVAKPVMLCWVNIPYSSYPFIII